MTDVQIEELMSVLGAQYDALLAIGILLCGIALYALFWRKR